MEFHHANATRQTELLARKKDEHAMQQKQIQEEEGARRSIVKNMVKETQHNLSPITDVLVHFEGMYI